MALVQITTATELASLRQQWRSEGRSLGLVPTMGNLHAGHLSLVREAKAQCAAVLATIFVNPLQFGPNEDFGRYPRTLAADLQALTAAGCDAVFTPTVAMLYPAGLEQHTLISVPRLSALYCGKSRPRHFDGVCTVVNSLFNMTQPDAAFFGLKDYQQFFLLRKMVADLHMPVRLIGVPTVREASGLALSSRNGYLSPAQKLQAAALYRTLTAAAGEVGAGADDYAALCRRAEQTLRDAGFVPDYVEIASQRSLLPATPEERSLVLLAAAWLDKTRLIDNVLVERTSGLP